MKQVNVKKLILPNIPYVFIALLATKVSEAVRLAPGSDASTKLLNIMTGLNTAFHSLVPSFHPIDLCVGVAAAIAIRLAVYIKGKNAKKFRKNLEYGNNSKKHLTKRFMGNRRGHQALRRSRI